MSTRTAIADRLQSLTDAVWQRLGPKLEPLLERYRALDDRSQRALQVLAVFGAAFVLWLLALPFLHYRSSAQSSLAAERVMAQKIEQLAAMGSAQPSLAASTAAQSMLTVIDSASNDPALGKRPSRLQPDGDKRVTVWLEDVPFDNLSRWLGTLQSRHGVVVERADFRRRAVAGAVDAQLTLGRP